MFFTNKQSPLLVALSPGASGTPHTVSEFIINRSRMRSTLKYWNSQLYSISAQDNKQSYLLPIVLIWNLGLMNRDFPIWFAPKRASDNKPADQVLTIIILCNFAMAKLSLWDWVNVLNKVIPMQYVSFTKTMLYILMFKIHYDLHA